MQIGFDPGKDEINRRKHKLSLAEAGLIDFVTMQAFPDNRKDYGEVRMQGYGYIGSRLHVLVYNMRGGLLWQSHCGRQTGER